MITGLFLTVILLIFEHPILTILGAKAATYNDAALITLVAMME